MGIWHDLMPRLRIFNRRRRNKKVSIISSVVIIIIFIIILIQSFHLISYDFNIPVINNENSNDKSVTSSSSSISPPTSNSALKTSPTIDNPEHRSWFWNLPQSILDNFRKKTVPFAQKNSNSNTKPPSNPPTSLTVDSESTIISLPNDDSVPDEYLKTKYRLINDFHKKFDPNDEKLNIGYQYFNDVFKILYNGKPKIDKLDNYLTKDRIYHARYDTIEEVNENDDKNPIFNQDYLSNFLQLNDLELNSMIESHDFVIKNLPDIAPVNLYKGDGIVFVGGGKFNWLTLLSIKSIRALGSTLPIEVLIPKIDEYEPDLCARVFPALNARCIYLPHILSGINKNKDSFVNKFEFKGFQYKALAILVLSFENVLLLDSDNIPVHIPDNLFKKDPFISNGLIVWPDFWKRATSPDYYRIAGIKISQDELLPKYNEIDGIYEDIESFNQIDSKKIPLHQRKGSIPDPTSESGQLMISKKTHTKVLLLALYYNLYGPTHFYPLFSQGSDGEGDKETFLAATCALNKPFYQVSKFLNAFGYFDLRNEFKGTGMGQYDPIEDLEVIEKKNLLKTKSIEDQEKFISKDYLLKKGPRILFVHANYPKLNPWELKSKQKIIDSKGNRIRLYGTGMKVRTGYDFETVQWSNMKFLLCELKIQLEIFKNVNRNELCSEINEHLDFLKSTISTLE